MSKEKVIKDMKKKQIKKVLLIGLVTISSLCYTFLHPMGYCWLREYNCKVLSKHECLESPRLGGKVRNEYCVTMVEESSGYVFEDDISAHLYTSLRVGETYLYKADSSNVFLKKYPILGMMLFPITIITIFISFGSILFCAFAPGVWIIRKLINYLN